MSLEPYLITNDYLVWFNDSEAYNINRVEILRLNFNKIFLSIHIFNHKTDLTKRGGFEKIDLHYTNLADMNLSYANLKNAVMNNTNLRNAILPEGFFSDNQKIQISHLKKMKIPGLRM